MTASGGSPRVGVPVTATAPSALSAPFEQAVPIIDPDGRNAPFLCKAAGFLESLHDWNVKRGGTPIARYSRFLLGERVIPADDRRGLVRRGLLRILPHFESDKGNALQFGLIP